jgi:uncharacterized protein (TIGR02231 family)
LEFGKKNQTIMRSGLWMIALLLSFSAYSQDFRTQTVSSEVEAVRVYLSGAQVFRTVELNLSRGNHSLIVQGLSPHLDENTLQVNAEGEVVILSVNRSVNYLEEAGQGSRADSLRQEIELLDSLNQLDRVRIEVLKEKQALLQANRQRNSNPAGSSLTELREALYFFDSEMSKLMGEKLSLERGISRRDRRLEQMEKQLISLQSSQYDPASEIEVRLRAESSGSVRLWLSYLVNNAGWTPKYDIRVADVASPFQLAYKAEVYQNTREDWQNVQLSFSTTNPNQSGRVPALEKWYLSFVRKARSRGAVPAMREPGKYDQAAITQSVSPELQADEALPPNSQMETTLTEQEVDLVFEIDEPYTLRSGTGKRVIDLQQHEIPAEYSYEAVPKLDPAAFITARFTDWDQYGLLPGPANLFFEEAFVGRTFLEAQALEDSLSLSLGRDRNLTIERKVDETFAKKRSIGSNVVETRGIQITIRNNKSQKVDIRILDQIPLPANNEITVSAEELSGASLNEETGEVSWNLSLAPQETVELTLRYEVRYPKKEQVILE